MLGVTLDWIAGDAPSTSFRWTELPKLQLYFLASQLAQIKQWFSTSVRMAMSDVIPYALKHMVCVSVHMKHELMQEVKKITNCWSHYATFVFDLFADMQFCAGGALALGKA